MKWKDKANNNSNPLVYIVMPVYNWEKYLLEQLMSIYYQNYTNWYLIFVNDWSTDSSENILLDWISHYNLHNRVKLISKENGGVNSAVSRWLEEVRKMCDIHSSDSLISYCDQDDIRTREKLSIQVEYMINHPECDLSFHDLCIVDENWIITNPSELKNKYLKNFSFFYLAIIWNFLISAEMMFKIKYIDDILPMCIWPCIYQDERTVYVFSLIEANIQCINKQLAYHRIWHQSLLKVSQWKYKSSQYQLNKSKTFSFLQKRFPEKNISYIINYRYDRFVNWYNKYWLISRRVYTLMLLKYPKIFFLLLKDFLYKFFKKSLSKIM